MPRKLSLPLTAFAAGLALAIVCALAGPTAQTSADPTLDPEEQAFVTLINNYRAQYGLGALAIDWEMQSSSDWMSDDMGINRYVDHFDHCVGDCINGHQYDATQSRDPWARMCAFGYCYNTWKAENIAAGFATANDVFTAWKNSSGHNANMLGPNYIAMGISRQYISGSIYGWYWTNDFGGVKSNAAAPSGGGSTSTQTPAPTATPSPSPSPVPTPSPVPVPVGLSGPTDGDPDHDGFATSRELFLGTDPTRFCGTDAWPPDFNGDGRVDMFDAMMFTPSFGPAHIYNAREDLNGDHYITPLDVFTLARYFHMSCVP